MGRGKIQIRKIENRTTRQVTFSKRRVGLLKKAKELSILCDAEIGLIIFSSNGKLFEFCSEFSSMENIIRKYEAGKGTPTRAQENYDMEQIMRNEFRRMKIDTDSLELNMQCYTGEDLSPLQYADLLQLEKQLECSIHKVQARKFEILQQQAEASQRKVKMLEVEHDQMHHLMMNEHQSAIEQQKAAVMVAKAEEGRRGGGIDEFPFFGEEGPSSVLQLAPFPLHYQPYRVQPSQPNLLDFTLHHPPYG